MVLDGPSVHVSLPTANQPLECLECGIYKTMNFQPLTEERLKRYNRKNCSVLLDNLSPQVVLPLLGVVLLAVSRPSSTAC